MNGSSVHTSVSSDDRENVPPTQIKGKPNVPADKSHEFGDADDVKSWVHDPLENYLILRLQTLMEHKMLESIPVKRLGHTVSEYLEMNVNPATNWKKSWKKIATKWARLGCFELRDEVLYPNKEILDKLSATEIQKVPVEEELASGDFLKTIDNNLPMSPKFNAAEEMPEKNEDEANEDGSVYEEEIKDFKCEIEPIPPEEDHYVDDKELQEPGDYSPKNLVGTPKACVATPHSKYEPFETSNEGRLSSAYEHEIRELTTVHTEPEAHDASLKHTLVTVPEVPSKNEVNEEEREEEVGDDEEVDEEVEDDDEIDVEVENYDEKRVETPESYEMESKEREMRDASLSAMEPSTTETREESDLVEEKVEDQRINDEAIENQEIHVKQPEKLHVSFSNDKKAEEIVIEVPAESEPLNTSHSALDRSRTPQVEEKVNEEEQKVAEDVKPEQIDVLPVHNEIKELPTQPSTESEEPRSCALTVGPSSIEGETQEEETNEEKTEGPRKPIKSSHHVRKCCFFL